MSSLQDRKLAMDSLRESVKKSAWKYSGIASAARVSERWVGEILRGNYPGYKNYLLPKSIRVALQERNFEVPDILVTF